jgi:hypothetical protein
VTASAVTPHEVEGRKSYSEKGPLRHLAIGRMPPETDHPLPEDGRVDEGFPPEQVPEPGITGWVGVKTRSSTKIPRAPWRGRRRRRAARGARPNICAPSAKGGRSEFALYDTLNVYG